MQRDQFLAHVSQSLAIHPVVALLGPRQCGKTTLAKAYAASVQPHQLVTYFDLEDPEDLAKLSQPKQVLSYLKGLIIIDEIQCKSELFPLLRVLVDQGLDQRFLILGSASRELIHQSSESLAGRIQYIELTPFNYGETHDLKKLWLRGGFPRAFLIDDNEQSMRWRKSYIKTYLEQDIPRLGIDLSSQNLARFWNMLAFYHAGIFNASEIGQSLQINHKTVSRYLDILSGTFMVRELRPWYENIKKRQVKSPKIYFRDSGIYHALLNVRNDQELYLHPKLGLSWEGFAMEEIIRFHQADNEECFFWSTHADAELDLLIFKNGEKQGFEFKYADAPRLTKSSMLIAVEDLKLSQITVIYPGEGSYPLHDKIVAMGLEYYLAAKPKP